MENESIIISAYYIIYGMQIERRCLYWKQISLVHI